MKIWKKLRRGEFGLVTIMETDFLAGLTRVMAKTLSGVGREAGLGRV
jgi:hypothetical protein